MTFGSTICGSVLLGIVTPSLLGCLATPTDSMGGRDNAAAVERIVSAEEPVTGAEATEVMPKRETATEASADPLEPPTLQAPGDPIPCRVGFDSPISLMFVSNSYHAYTTFVYAPFYTELCLADTRYFVQTKSLNMDHYHLGYEFQQQESPSICFGENFTVGPQDESGNCRNLQDAMNFPRIAANMQSGSGIQFTGGWGSDTRRRFDLKKLDVITGTVVVKVYRVDAQKWSQWTLGPGRWIFSGSAASYDLTFVRVYHKDVDGIFNIDNLDISMQVY